MEVELYLPNNYVITLIIFKLKYNYNNDMPNKLMSIDILLYAHGAIRTHIKQVARLISSSKTDKSFNAKRTQMKSSFDNPRLNLKEVVDNFYEDIRRHLIFEEEILPGLIGDIVMESILIEHRKISQEMNEMVPLFHEIGSQNSSVMNEGLGKRINDFITLLLAHCETEDTILKLIRRSSPERILV